MSPATKEDRAVQEAEEIAAAAELEGEDKPETADEGSSASETADEGSSASVAALVTDIEDGQVALLETRALKRFKSSLEKKGLDELAEDFGTMIEDRAVSAGKVSKLKRALRLIDPENPAVK